MSSPAVVHLDCHEIFNIVDALVDGQQAAQDVVDLRGCTRRAEVATWSHRQTGKRCGCRYTNMQALPANSSFPASLHSLLSRVDPRLKMNGRVAGQQWVNVGRRAHVRSGVGSGVPAPNQAGSCLAPCNTTPLFPHGPLTWTAWLLNDGLPLLRIRLAVAAVVPAAAAAAWLCTAGVVPRTSMGRCVQQVQPPDCMQGRISSSEGSA